MLHCDPEIMKLSYVKNTTESSVLLINCEKTAVHFDWDEHVR